jgi:hypothetical protein
MTLVQNDSPSADSRLQQAIGRLYSACHLSDPKIVVARNATEYARVCQSLTRRSGVNLFCELMMPFGMIMLFFSVVASGVKGLSSQSGSFEHAIDGLLLGMSFALVLFVAVFPSEPNNPPHEGRPPLHWRLGVTLLIMGSLAACAWGIAAFSPRQAAFIAICGTMALIVPLLLGRLLWPFWRRLELSRDLGSALPLRGCRPVQAVIEHRLGSAISTLRTSVPTDPGISLSQVRREPRQASTELVEQEARRLAGMWRNWTSLLGPAGRDFTAYEVARLTLEDLDPELLPTILQAAVEIDRRADAICVFDGIAVLLPAGAPLTYPQRQEPGSTSERAKIRHAGVFDWLGYRGPLAALVAVIPHSLGDYLMVRYLVRVPEASRRTGAIRSFGLERFFAALKPKPVQEDRFGRLFMIGRPQDPSGFVEIEDATISPDGSRRRYWLSVPPHVATAHEGVAATFGKTAGTYAPKVET